MHLYLSNIYRRPLIPFFIGFQIIVATAILCNVLFQGWINVMPMLAHDGVDETNLILVDGVDNIKHPWTQGQIDSVLGQLSNISGVRKVSAAFGLPMIPNQLVAFSLGPPDGLKITVNGYYGKNLLGTLGADLTSGHNFSDNEYTRWGLGGPAGQFVPREVTPIIITQTLATRWFPEGDAVDKQLVSQSGGSVSRYLVVGIVSHLISNRISISETNKADDTVLLPYEIGASQMVSFAIRVRPGQASNVESSIKSVIGHFLASGQLPLGNAKVASYESRRDAIFSDQRAATWVFAAVTLAVTAVALAGNLGLSAYWVRQRRRDIGIRRALGASRLDIIILFQLENIIIVGPSILIGMALAFLFNSILLRYYELTSLPLYFLPWGGLVMFAICQAGAYGPSREASRVSPADAIRSR